MKKFLYIFFLLFFFENVFTSPNIPNISNESSDNELEQFVFLTLKEKISLDVFKRVMHCNTKLLLVLNEIRQEFFELFDYKLKVRLVPIAANCLYNFFGTNKGLVNLKSKEDDPTKEEVEQLRLIMHKDRLSWATSSNELDMKLSNLHNEFIELMEFIHNFLDLETVSSVLSEFEFYDYKNMTKEDIKKDTFLKLAEALVGFKTDERKVTEIEKLKSNINCLKTSLNIKYCKYFT